MKKLLFIVSLPLLLNACSTAHDMLEPTILTPADLQHHRWVLTQINGEAITQPQNKAQVSSLEIGENMFANGMAGCNTYQGQASINPETGEFKINKMAMTMKMCIDDAMIRERAVASTLSAWSEIEMGKDTLEIKGDEYTLTYQLSEWVN